MHQARSYEHGDGFAYERGSVRRKKLRLAGRPKPNRDSRRHGPRRWYDEACVVVVAAAADAFQARLLARSPPVPVVVETSSPKEVFSVVSRSNFWSVGRSVGRTKRAGGSVDWSVGRSVERQPLARLASFWGGALGARTSFPHIHSGRWKGHRNEKRKISPSVSFCDENSACEVQFWRQQFRVVSESDRVSAVSSP